MGDPRHHQQEGSRKEVFTCFLSSSLLVLPPTSLSSAPPPPPIASPPAAYTQPQSLAAMASIPPPPYGSSSSSSSSLPTLISQAYPHHTPLHTQGANPRSTLSQHRLPSSVGCVQLHPDHARAHHLENGVRCIQRQSRQDLNCRCGCIATVEAVLSLSTCLVTESPSSQPVANHASLWSQGKSR